MEGTTVVITGATSGIGLVAARALAGKGARIVMVARDPGRAQAALQSLPAPRPSGAHAVHIADLSRLGEMARVAGEIAAAEPRIDVLMNNAGALFGRRLETADGLEMTFAVNHMAYFVMTRGLLRRLCDTPGARVVNTASAAHFGQRLDFDDLQARRRYSPFTAYGRSKLANILFTRELSRRLQGAGVTANCLHPGFVATRFGDASGGISGAVIGAAKRLFAITPEKGAETMVYLASSQKVDGVTGKYFANCRPLATSVQARDDGAAARLWAASEAIAG